MLRPTSIPQGQLYIDGVWCEGSSDARAKVIDPSRAEVIGTLSRATKADVERAVAAARRQVDGGEWSRLSGADRGRLLWQLADLVDGHREELAALEAVDIGRPYNEPFFAEIPAAAEVFRFFAGYADKIEGSTYDLPTFGGRPRLSYTLRQPLGVVGAITPWNAPTMIASWKLAPALAAGNTVVLKPAEEASLSTIRLVELVEQAGFPGGTVNLVTGAGSEAGEALVRSPGVDKISFTGSPEVGRRIAATASAELKRVVLELGGKSPQIVRQDADIDQILDTVGLAVFANQGQTCASGSRILVHRSIAGEFTERLAAHAAAISVGDPFDPATQMGTLISQKQLDRVSGYVQTGLREGAELATGGSRIGEIGYFFQPTVFVSHNQSTIAREEIFGPVGTVISFDDDDQALRLANESDYGLTSVLWTKDISAINSFSRALRTGSVWVNAWGPPHPALPWFGVKTSGLGEELGRGSLLAETVEKTINIIG